MKKHTKVYLSALLVLLIASAYPIYMGVVTLSDYLQNGYVVTQNYPKYVIPYTPLCIALLLSVALLPLFKRFTLPALSLIGVAAFLALEVGFEHIKVLDGAEAFALESWQYSLCIATPEALQAIGEPLYAQDNPAYKVHFYLIALAILLAVIHTVYGFYTMAKKGDYRRKRPLTAQLVSVIFFIGLCVLACFTAFFREGNIEVSPLSAVLMALFFIVFGQTLGLYFGSLFYRKGWGLSILLPSGIAALTTLIMYVGELMLMGGELFRFGTGWFFSALSPLPFAPVDILIILLSGAIAYGLMVWLNPSETWA